MDHTYISVEDLNHYIQSKFTTDLKLRKVFVRGEVSNCKNHNSGHVYFTLKDENSRINCVCFKGHASKLDFIIENGMEILIIGKVEVFQSAGTYQIYVEQATPDGIGSLHIQFEKLKNNLLKEGLFDQEHKKEIPKFPNRIAVLTAYPSAAVMDILKTISNRFPATRVFVFPIPVQGKNAHLDISNTLLKVDNMNFSSIILARGGGSIEDLWNFNEENLIRTIFDCRTPVISGIGHETDITLCDFVSDIRATTPTGAAVIATPNCVELIQNVEQTKSQLITIMKNKLETQNHKLSSVSSSHFFRNPETLIYQKRMTFDHLNDQFKSSFNNIFINNKNSFQFTNQQLLNVINIKIVTLQNSIELQKSKLIQTHSNYLIKNQNNFTQVIAKLDALSPLKILNRGYSVVSKEGQLIRSKENLKNNDIVKIKFHDGDVDATINKGE